MGKKKRGGNKKNKAGGRGGNKPSSADGAPKKQYCGRREVSSPAIKVDDDKCSAVVEVESAGAAKEFGEIESNNCVKVAETQSNDKDDNFIGDVQIIQPIQQEGGTTERGIDGETKVAYDDDRSCSGRAAADKAEAGISNSDAVEKGISEMNVEAPSSKEEEDIVTPTDNEDNADATTTVESSGVNGDVNHSSSHDSYLTKKELVDGDGTTERFIKDEAKVARDVNDEIAAGVSSSAAIEEVVSDEKVETQYLKEEEDIIVASTDGEDNVGHAIGSTNSKDLQLRDINDEPSHDSDPTEKEPIDAATEDQSTVVERNHVDGTCGDDDVLSRSMNDSAPTAGIEMDSSTNGNETLRVVESYSRDNDISFQSTKEIGPYSSQLSQEMEEVDLDSPDKLETLPPLVRAFNGTPNGISPATHNTLSFTFQDSTEKEAFVFLTASLRETLGDDANNVSDETLSRYIRWKPDVKRASDRFRAYLKFRKENSYLFDDKPLQLSQDPKLLFLIQNGMTIAPEELVAKDGSAVVILRGAKCDVTAHNCDNKDTARAIIYILQTVLERRTFDPLKGITFVLDLVAVSRRNVPKRIANLLSKAAGCFPLRVREIYVVAMPWWFPSGNTKLFSATMRNRIHFLKNKVALSEFIEKDYLLEEDGGIYNFDLRQWISSVVLREVEQL